MAVGVSVWWMAAGMTCADLTTGGLSWPLWVQAPHHLLLFMHTLVSRSISAGSHASKNMARIV